MTDNQRKTWTAFAVLPMFPSLLEETFILFELLWLDLSSKPCCFFSSSNIPKQRCRKYIDICFTFHFACKLLQCLWGHSVMNNISGLISLVIIIINNPSTSYFKLRVIYIFTYTCITYPVLYQWMIMNEYDSHI